MAGAGISPSTTSIEPSPSNDNEQEHPTNHNHNDDDVCSRESSEPVVVSPAPTEEDDDDDDEDNELFVHAAAKDDAPPPFQNETSISISIPSFYKAGLSKKATPLALSSWTALSLTLDGRDKLTKVFQYVTRLLGWWLAGGSSNNNASQRFLNLSKSLSNSRKAFRLGRSLVELDKLRSMGLVDLMLSHLQPQGSGHEETETTLPHPKTLATSSNGPMTVYQSLSSMAYRNMYRPLVSRMSQSEQLWMAIGSAIKVMALFGFWIGDNVNFLSSSGAFDNLDITTSHKERMARRNQLSTLAGVRANQAYFAGSIAGLLVNWRTYFVFQRNNGMRPVAQAHLKQQVVVMEESEESSPQQDKDRTMQQLVKLQEKQFSLFLALLKVCSLG
jgi:hypothetical protein